MSARKNIQANGLLAVISSLPHTFFHIYLLNACACVHISLFIYIYIINIFYNMLYLNTLKCNIILLVISLIKIRFQEMEQKFRKLKVFN